METSTSDGLVPTARIALDLFFALCAEAREWAFDDSADVLDRIDSQDPRDALVTLGESPLVPAHLYGPVAAALAHLDPATFATPQPHAGASAGELVDRPARYGVTDPQPDRPSREVP